MKLHLLLTALLMCGAPAYAQDELPATDGEIVVTAPGEAEEQAKGRSVVLGSRLPQADLGLGNGTVSTKTGVAGLGPGSGMSPFSNNSRKRTVIECRADAGISEDVACALVEVEDLIEESDYAAARADLDRLRMREGLTPQERYATEVFAYRLAQREGDRLDREQALAALTDSGMLPAEDEAKALRTLVSMALSRGANDEAIARLQQLVTVAPTDSRSRANLGVLLSRQGDQQAAARHLAAAIEIAEMEGDRVDPAWREFVAARSEAN